MMTCRWEAIRRFGLGLVMVCAASVVHAQANGVQSEGCAVKWHAQALLNSGLPDSSTTQFLWNVADANGGPGVMQVQHWVGGTPSAPTLNWRIPLATVYPIHGGIATVTLPNVPAGTTINYVSDASLQNFMSTRAPLFGWGTYTWTPLGVGTNNGDGTWTFDLGDMAANSAHAFLFTMTLPAGTSTAQNFLASVDLTGTYTFGSPTSCMAARVPANQPWALLLLGAASAAAAAWQLRRRV